MSNPNPDPNQVHAATLKLPVFWPQDPEVWFTMVEAQFATRGLTGDGTKYSYLVSSLTPETASEVRDLLIAPPENDKYATLKQAIIQKTTASAETRLKQLLMAEELDGRKPTQLLRRMRQLIGTNTALVSDQLLKHLFVPRLPTQAQVVLASSNIAELDKLAELADKIVEVVGPHVSAVNAPDDGGDIAALRKELAEMKSLLRGRSRDKSSNQATRNRSKTPAKKTTDDGKKVCWFHAKFGDKAKNCRDPCEYKSGNASGSR